MVLTLLVLLTSTACVGPNKLKRGLDKKLNENYVKRPLLAQLMFPVNLLANHLAVAGDLLIINPTYWWPDVIRGEGTPYNYTNPEMPAEASAAAEAGCHEKAAEKRKNADSLPE
jgi:hypothetical protein